MKTPGLGGARKKPYASDAGLKNRGKAGAGKITGKAKAKSQSDAGLKNRGKIGAGKITGATMSKNQKDWDVPSHRNRVGIDAYKKDNAKRAAAKKDGAAANREGITKVKPKAPKITGRGVKIARRAMLATAGKGKTLGPAASNALRYKRSRGASGSGRM